MNSATDNRDASSRTWLAHQLWLLRRRHGFLVNPRRQLRAAFMTTVPILLLLILVNVLFYIVRAKEMETVLAIAPSLEETIHGVEASETMVGIVASVIVLVGVFVVTILETHRTSGAALKIRSRLLRVADGRYDTGLELRTGDNLRELEEPFDRMTAALRDRATADADDLEQLADQLESAATTEKEKQVAAELRTKAEDLRSRVR
jgi:methyl-accepting chemotaxis protein